MRKPHKRLIEVVRKAYPALVKFFLNHLHYDMAVALGKELEYKSLKHFLSDLVIIDKNDDKPRIIYIHKLGDGSEILWGPIYLPLSDEEFGIKADTDENFRENSPANLYVSNTKVSRWGFMEWLCLFNKEAIAKGRYRLVPLLGQDSIALDYFITDTSPEDAVKEYLENEPFPHDIHRRQAQYNHALTEADEIWSVEDFLKEHKKLQEQECLAKTSSTQKQKETEDEERQEAIPTNKADSKEDKWTQKIHRKTIPTFRSEATLFKGLINPVSRDSRDKA